MVKSVNPDKTNKTNKKTKKKHNLTRRDIIRQRKQNELIYQQAKHQIKHQIKQIQQKNSSGEDNQKENSIEENLNREDIRIDTKIINNQQNHVWIHMVGTGSVTLKLVMEKMDDLQNILDNMAQVPDLKFTFVFDFRMLDEFAELATLKKFGSFMKFNQPLFERKLNQSYLLLRKFIWRMVVKTLFTFYRPTQPVEFDIPPEIDKALCQDLS
jgi:hypothetical protein